MRLRRLLLPSMLALAAAQALAQSSPATRPPAGSPSDVRYTELTGGIGGAALHPRAPDQDASPPRLLRSDAAAKAVARIIVEVDRDAVPADGQAAVELSLQLLDKAGQPLTAAVMVTIEWSGGRLLLNGARTDEAGPRGLDADPVTPGVQLRVEGGQARLTLLAPHEAQDVRVRVSAGPEEAAGTISFVPDRRPMVAAGLVEGIVSLRSRPQINPVRRGDPFEQEIERWSREFRDGRGAVAARTAFYLKGTIRGDLLLTAAYDSDKDTRARLLRDIRPDELYPVLGDASLRSFDARSGERLYVRIDKDKSYALFGDFVTGDGFSQPIGQGAVASLKQRSLGNVNRTATGARLHHEQAGLVGNLFAFRDTLRQVVEEIASQGSGPYGLRNNAVLEGSEKVEVIVRDRNQPSRIVSVRPLVRLVDYSFEPFSGRILLASFLPAVDADLNPVSLRISYEVDQGGEPFWVGGGDVQWRLNEKVELGGSLLHDRNALAPYDLVSANATLRLGPRTALVVEAAQTTSTVNTNPTNGSTAPGLAGVVGEIDGRAARLELVHEGERADARVFWGRSSPWFNNPGAPLAGGREELFAGGGYKLTERLKLLGEAARSEDRNAGGGERSLLGAALSWAATERLTLQLGLRQQQELIGSRPNGGLSWPYDQTRGLSSSLASGSGGGVLGFGNQTLDPATGLPVINSGGFTPATTSLAAGTELESTSVRLGAGLRVDERTQLGAEVESSVDGDRRSRLALGAEREVAERTRLYGRWERQSGWVQLGGVSDVDRSAGALSLGVDSTYFRDTQLFSEYRLRDAIAGRDLQLASGIRQQWSLAEGWRANGFVERLRVISGATAPVQAIGGGLEWTAHPLWRGTARAELRRSGDIGATPDNEEFQTTLLQGLLARKLSRDWTLLARNHTLLTDYAARGDVLQNRAQLGLAWRDTDTNRSNALARIEYKTERDASNAAVGTLRSRAWITSLHADHHPSRPWWLSGRIAGKWQRDQFEAGATDAFRAALVSGRVVYDIGERWDIGAMASAQFGQRGARQTAWGAEVGYLVQTNVWLSGGFNVSGFAGDADLVGYEYTRRGAYIRLRIKFDEDVFRSRNRDVNRSLDR